MSAPVRVVLGEDDVLMREGIARLLAEGGFEVVAQAGDADELLRKALAHHPDVVVADVQMPPGLADDGLRAALELRRQRPETGVLVLSQFYEPEYALDLIGDRASGVGYLLKERVADVHMPPGLADAGLRAALSVRRQRPETGVLVLSQYYEEEYALELIGEHPEGVGYLLKERVGDVEAFLQAVARVAGGGSALDPEVVGRMLGRRRANGPLDRLSPRERDVLAAMAEGKSNQGIADALVVTEAAIEKHVTGIFQKLELGPTPTEHRRVLAVLTYLRGSAS